jgi:chemotaxis protein methyltransferase CheR
MAANASASSSLSPNEREFSFSDEEFRVLATIANKHTGIVLAEHKKDMVYSRLVRRLRALKLSSFSEYCDLLQGPHADDEMGDLVNAITTNLTSFFRESHHFEHLRDEVLAPLVAARANRLRIWSAGCSQGMEPYSIAMTMKAALKGGSSLDAKILATDIDTNMLDKCNAGIYPFEQYENIPSIYRGDVNKISGGQSIEMSHALKESISFKHLNLLEAWPMKGPFDVIFCRNVVIYFDKTTQAELFRRMAELLKPRGFLYIGHSENLFKVSTQFELIGRTIYRKL